MWLIKLAKLSLFSLSFFGARVAVAAACCGGGFAIPSLITGDEAASLTSSFSYSKIDTDVFTNSVWQKRRDDDVSQILKIEAASVFLDRYQAGFSVPLQTRNRSGAQGGSSSGVGDMAAQVGYEYLPDWDYSEWRPRGVGFVTLTLPTGKSIYESEKQGALDSTGRGFWALGVGTALTKAWTTWDSNIIIEGHRGFNKSIVNSQISGTLKPGFGGSLAVGSGYNLAKFRFGGSIAWTYEDAIDVAGTTSSLGSAQRYATGTAMLTQLLDADWAWTLSYADQTLFGSPTNTTLAQTLAFTVQKRFSR